MELVSNKVQWKFQQRPNSPKIMFSNLGQIPSQNLCCLLCLLSQLFSNEHHAKPQSGVLADVHHLDCGLFTRSSDWLSNCYNSDWGRVKSNVLIKIKLDVTQYFQAWESDSPVTDQIDLPLQILQGGFLFTFLIFLEWYSPQFLW